MDVTLRGGFNMMLSNGFWVAVDQRMGEGCAEEPGPPPW